MQTFVEAGLEYSIEGESGRALVQHLVTVSEFDSSAGPEQILELTSGPERSFVSKCLFDCPEIDDDQLQEEAAEKVLWLKENSLKIKMKQLTAQINQAQQENNTDLLMRLLTEKTKLRGR